MLLYRIAKAEHIRDLSGTGARAYGGRWNHKGIPVVYTSESRSLAALEYLVHTNFTNLPDNLQIAGIEVPPDALHLEIPATDLPAGWRDYPPPLSLADIGTDWAKSGRSFLLKVPSAVMPRESNIIINCLHPDLRRIDIAEVEDFEFDRRLFPDF